MAHDIFYVRNTFSRGIKRSACFMNMKLAFSPRSTKCLVTSVVDIALLSIPCNNCGSLFNSPGNNIANGFINGPSSHST